MTDRHLATNKETKVLLKNLSVHDFRNFGLQQIAYIRKLEAKDIVAYSVYSADGECIVTMDTLAEAIVSARQKNLEPVVVH